MFEISVRLHLCLYHVSTMTKNKKHSVSSFQDEWLSDPAFRSWISKIKNTHKACCFLCKTSFDISVMGVSALRSHAKGKKHQARASRQRCEVLTSDTLLVTKRILMIVVNLFLLLPLQLLKQHLPLLTGAKTYIVWMLKFAGTYAWSTVTAATTVVLI